MERKSNLMAEEPYGRTKLRKGEGLGPGSSGKTLKGKEGQERCHRLNRVKPI